MREMTAAARPAARAPRRPAPRRPDLRVVTTSPRPTPRLPFVLLCSLLLAAGLLTMLALNMALASGSYALHDLQERSAVLDAQEESLGERIAALSAPAALAERATDLGMVPSVSPGFLRLPDGEVIGEPRPAPPAPPPPAPTASPTTATATPGPADGPTAPPSSTPTATQSRNTAEARPAASATGAPPARPPAPAPSARPSPQRHVPGPPPANGTGTEVAR